MTPPLTEEEVKIIAEAIDNEKLEWKGKEGEILSYAPNQQTPYTGWVKWMGNKIIIKYDRQMKEFRGGLRQASAKVPRRFLQR